MLKKHDLIIVFIVLCLVALSFFLFRTDSGVPGNKVRVSVDGKEQAVYSLDSDSDIPLKGYDGHDCRLRITNGTACMLEADCPNQLCVNHKPVRNTGEVIVCLPNRISIEVFSEADTGEFDAVVR